jgi:putative two-component system response regulator
LSHHEWWNGAGYPQGLQGEDIPQEARIAGICDVFDALTSARPYKEPWPEDEAVAEIRRLMGEQFDPVVARAFLAITPEIFEIRSRYRDRELPR